MPCLHPDYMQGKIKVDEYVTHDCKLEDINQGFDDMHVSHTYSTFNSTSRTEMPQSGNCIRCVVDMS
jgi:S-(hydroxymethyl)glutathione dehydrogenase / alcohol dehydrogenase